MSDPFGDFAHQRKYLMGVARARGLNTMDAEDAVSSAVLSLLERYQGADFDVLRAAGPLTVHRKVVDGARKRAVEMQRDEQLRDARSTNAAAPAEAVMLWGEEWQAVGDLRAQVLSMVGEEFQELDGAIFDAIVSGLPPVELSAEYRRIATLHNRPPETLKSRAEKVRSRMRRVYLGGRSWRAL